MSIIMEFYTDLWLYLYMQVCGLIGFLFSFLQVGPVSQKRTYGLIGLFSSSCISMSALYIVLFL